jgi:hypothetical protein
MSQVFNLIKSVKLKLVAEYVQNNIKTCGRITWILADKNDYIYFCEFNLIGRYITFYMQGPS